MYDLIYLPIAKKDLEEIIDYIFKKLEAPIAALDFLDSFESSIEHLKSFPYSHSVYKTIRNISLDYRIVTVNNYLVFYIVDEENKNVEIHRVLYGKRNIDNVI